MQPVRRPGTGERSGNRRVLPRQLPRERSEEHTSELQSRQYLVCRLLLEKKKKMVQVQTNKLLLSPSVLHKRQVTQRPPTISQPMQRQTRPDEIAMHPATLKAVHHDARDI